MQSQIDNYDSLIPDDEAFGEYGKANFVKKIDFRNKTSILKNKGRPVESLMLPLPDDERWIIQCRETNELSKFMSQNEEKILKELLNIETKIDLIEMAKNDFLQDFSSNEKQVDLHLQRVMNQKLRIAEMKERQKQLEQQLDKVPPQEIPQIQVPPQGSISLSSRSNSRNSRSSSRSKISDEQIVQIQNVQQMKLQSINEETSKNSSSKSVQIENLKNKRLSNLEEEKHEQDGDASFYASSNSQVKQKDRVPVVLDDSVRSSQIDLQDQDPGHDQDQDQYQNSSESRYSQRVPPELDHHPHTMKEAQNEDGSSSLFVSIQHPNSQNNEHIDIKTEKLSIDLSHARDYYGAISSKRGSIQSDCLEEQNEVIKRESTIKVISEEESMSDNKIHNRKIKQLLNKKIQNVNNSIWRNSSVKVQEMKNLDSSYSSGENFQEHEQVLNDIKRWVQIGGDSCLQRFNSFGANDIDSSVQNSDQTLQISGLQKIHTPTQQSGSSLDLSEQSVNPQRQIPIQNQQLGSLFSQKLLDLESDKSSIPVLSSQPRSMYGNGTLQKNLEREVSKLSCQLSKNRSLFSDEHSITKSEDLGTQKNHIFDIEEQKAESDIHCPMARIADSDCESSKKPKKKQPKQGSLKDTQLNHSKILRQIEQMLNELMITYNQGQIIQMNLNQKLLLKNKVEKALNFRQKNSEQQNKRASNNNIKFNLSENDINIQDDQDPENNNKIDKIQLMREKYYKEKQALKKQNEQDKKNFSQINNSSSKIDKMSAFQKSFKVDYDFYFKNNQGIFVVQTQMKFVDLIKIQKKINIIDLLNKVPQFDVMRQELYQDNINFNQKTLCIDVQNVLVRQVNINEQEEMKDLKDAVANGTLNDYILVDLLYWKPEAKPQPETEDTIYDIRKTLQKHAVTMTQLIENYDTTREETKDEQIPKKDCCKLGQSSKRCMCFKVIYKIRPYTLDLIRAIQPFFEMIAISNMPYNEIEQIIDQIEIVLNKPINDNQIKQFEGRKERYQSSFLSRIQNNDKLSQNTKESLSNFLKQLQNKRCSIKIETKVYFCFLICNNNYIKVPGTNEFVEILFLMTLNRRMENIFLLTSNQFRLVAAMNFGFCAIPITKYQGFMTNDFQLNLVENYLLTLKYFKDPKSKNQCDFGYLSQSSKVLKKTQKEVQEQEDQYTSRQMSNLSFGERFSQLSLDMDCVIHEEQIESSSNYQTNYNEKQPNFSANDGSGYESKNMLGSIRSRINLNSSKTVKNNIFDNEIMVIIDDLTSESDYAEVKGNILSQDLFMSSLESLHQRDTPNIKKE